MIHFHVQFRENSSRFKVDFGTLTILPHAELYTGSYEIIPQVDLQTLPTGEKFLKHDMTVTAIPYFDVGNMAGGSTVYIGSEVE